MRLLLVLAALVCGHSPFSHADDANDPFARDLLIISQWFEGEFDNEEQLWFHTRSGAANEPPIRMHSRHVRLDLPKLGAHTFYVEEYLHNDPSQVSRQRLVIFSTEPGVDGIRMQQGFFRKPAKLVGKEQGSKALSKLTSKDIWFMNECDVVLKRVADQFKGGMQAKACVLGKANKARYSQHDIVLSATKYWRTDATFLLADDSFYKGTPAGEPTEFRQATNYVCDFYFSGPESQQQEVKNITIHSQGGTGTVVRDSDQQSFTLLIREKEYPYYATRPDFIYYSIRHTGAERSVAYGVADAESRQFGLRTKGVGAFCHHPSYNFREDFGAL